MQEKPSTRRTVLQSLAAAGALTLAACSSIIRIFRVSKAEAMYQDRPNANGQHCDDCRYFHAPDVCDRVEGAVSPMGWCRFYSGRG
jgi:hypothetical protein